MSDSIRDRVRTRIETYYDLQKLSKASEALAGANGLQGEDSLLRDSRDKPLKFGDASTNAIAHALTSALMGIDPRNPEQFAPWPQDDELSAFYRDDPVQPWSLQRLR